MSGLDGALGICLCEGMTEVVALRIRMSLDDENVLGLRRHGRRPCYCEIFRGRFGVFRISSVPNVCIR